MFIISHQGRSSQRPASFACHTMAQISYNPCILSVFQVKNRHFLILTVGKMPDRYVLRSPIFLAF